jgi:hypothetical protein
MDMLHPLPTLPNRALENAILLNDEPCHWAKLIRKLRWIGMEEEANEVLQALRSLPLEQRDTLFPEPHGTD